MRIEIVGIEILILSIALPFFTSSLWLTKEQKDLADLYKKNKDEIPKDKVKDAQQYYLDTKIVLIAKCLAAIGVCFVFIGFVF